MEQDYTSHDCLSGSLDGLSLEDVNADDEYGNTRLHKAVEESQEAVVDALLSKHADVNIKNEDGETPLMVAVKNGNEILVEKLITSGATVDSEDIDCNTPLLQAVMLNLKNIVGILLKNGASWSVENKNFQTPLLIAISMNFESIFDLLIEAGADVNAANSIHGTPIVAALTSVNLKIARKLLNNGALLDPTCVFYSLFHCYIKNFVKLFDFILNNGFDVNAQGFENLSLLHVAVIRSSGAAVRNLLTRSVNVNAKDKSGETPLHCAARISNRSITQLLLMYKSDVNVLNMNGQTPLYIAVMSLCGENVRLLLNAGADISIPQERSVLDVSLQLGPLSRKATSYMLCSRKMDLAQVRMYIFQNDGAFPKNFTNLCAFEAKCHKEIDQMKAMKFGSFSLFNILSDCNNPVFASNSDIEKYVKSNTLKIDFPLYGVLLKRKFIEAMHRNILLDDLSLRFRIDKGLNLRHIVLPKEISRKILLYLENHDLLNVNRAFSVYKQQFEK